MCVEYEGWKGEVRGEITWNRFRGTKEKFGGFKVTVLFLVIENLLRFVYFEFWRVLLSIDVFIYYLLFMRSCRAALSLQGYF